MGWVYMTLGDADPVAFADDPDVVAAAEARGYQVVENGELTAPAPEAVEPDEVDVHGQGWIYLTHPEVGGPARYPVEVADDMYAQGWVSPADAEAAALEESTKADLQAQLKELGLPVSGTKQELIDRLAEYEADEPVE